MFTAINRQKRRIIAPGASVRHERGERIGEAKASRCDIPANARYVNEAASAAAYSDAASGAG